MNPNWTGKAARTLGECRFSDDADPFERHRNSVNGADIGLSIVIGVLLALALVTWWAS